MWFHDPALPILAAPSFKGPIKAACSIAHDRWTPADGVLDVVYLAKPLQP